MLTTHCEPVLSPPKGRTARIAPCYRPANFGARLVRKASRPSWKSALP